MDPRAGVCHGKWTRPGIANSFALIKNLHSICRRKENEANVRKVGRREGKLSDLKAKSLASPVLLFTEKQEKKI